MNPIIPVYQWLELPHEVRMELAKSLQLKKSGGVQTEQRVLGGVVRGILISDGHTQEDLLAITPRKLEEYLGFAFSKSLLDLFPMAVEKAKCAIEGKEYVYTVPEKEDPEISPPKEAEKAQQSLPAKPSHHVKKEGSKGAKKSA